MERVYQDDKAGITIWHGDAFQLMPTLAPRQAALVLTDIPYGPDTQKGARTNRAGMGDKSPIGFGSFTEEQVLQAFWEFSRLSYRWVISTVDWQHALPLKQYAAEVDLRFIRACTWCLSGGTRLYARTKNGEGPATLKDLVRLDPKTVQLWGGTGWVRVTAWSANTNGRSGALELELRSGERIGCTAEHLWPTMRGNVRASDLTVGDVIRTCSLPEPPEPAQPAALPDSEVGWMVGLYLAEGSRGSDGCLQVSGHAKEVEQRLPRIRSLVESLDGRCAAYTYNNTSTINIYSPVLASTVDLYLGGSAAQDKHLKPKCWRRTNAFLRALLQGYLEGDGHYDVKNNRWRLGFARNYALEDGLRTIAARLNIDLRLRVSTARIGNRKYPAFRGEVRWRRPAENISEVVKIRGSKARRFWDVSVAEEPHLFALASGVLTHNCKTNGMPQKTADRPAQGSETIVYMHNEETPLRWHGGGRHGNFYGPVVRETGHPTEKPRWMISQLIQLFTDPGDLVIDPFMGSGTVLRCAKDLGRRAIGIELDRRWCDSTIHRLAQESLPLLYLPPVE